MTVFSALPVTAAAHFQLRFYAAVLRLRAQVRADDFPFLADYCADLDAVGLGDHAAFVAALQQWESGQDLPILRLQSVAQLGADDTDALLLLGLVDEDARFGAVFEHFTGKHRPTLGLLNTWWPQWRGPLRQLTDIGLLTRAADLQVQPEGRGADDTAVVPVEIWEALRGHTAERPAPWARHRRAAELPELADLILTPPVIDTVGRLPRLLNDGLVDGIVVTGPTGVGRRSLVGAVARARGLGVLEIDDLPADDPRWRWVGAWSTLLGAVPTLVVSPVPSETYPVPELPGRTAGFAVVARTPAAVTGPAVEAALTIELAMPRAAQRARLWTAALGSETLSRQLGDSYRMTAGCIRRIGGMARAEAAFAGRDAATTADVIHAAATVHGRLLSGRAQRVDTCTDWGDLAVNDPTLIELLLLETRCRQREQLPGAVGSAAARGLTSGVRALLTGPSGTGKTLAARALAGALSLDLFRLNLAGVVDKYLGETEKNLEQAFSCAEEADVVLLIDEGDALLTQRTAVRTSNDRYANLETNYLLQRLESFDGIVVITTNAGERIDDAFRRRMDVVVDFTAPDEAQRWAIWQLHLPAQHTIPAVLVAELAERCVLTGGQIRNAVLHAAVLALDDCCPISAQHLARAVRREHAKSGLVCPMTWEAYVG